MTTHRGAARKGEPKSGEERVRERSGEKNLGRWGAMVVSPPLSRSIGDDRLLL